MMSLDHQCVVQLLGISHGPPVFMVMELVPLGKQGISHGPPVFMFMELVPIGK